MRGLPGRRLNRAAGIGLGVLGSWTTRLTGTSACRFPAAPTWPGNGDSHRSGAVRDGVVLERIRAVLDDREVGNGL